MGCGGSKTAAVEPELAPRGDVFAAQISLVSEGETDEARVLGTVHSAPEPLSGAECNAANGPAAGIVASTLPHRDIESAVAFLLAKRVFADDPAMQATQFNYLRNPRSAPPGRVHEYEKHQRVALKLMSLLVHGEHVEARPPTEEQLDLSKFPGFKLHGVFAGRSADLVQRHQLSTACKEHAAAVMEQYTTFFAQLSNNSRAVLAPRMLDMAEQFRSASSGMLGRHVFWIGDALRSEDVLRELLEPDSVVAASAAFEESLVKHGPGLITSFRVYDDFKDKSVKCHFGAPTGTFRNKFGKERRLAMVLLAVRTDAATGMRFLLVQNFWKGKQFVTMDEVYFEACLGTVFFVKTRQPVVPHGTAARSAGAWVEADGGSSPDSQD